MLKIESNDRETLRLLRALAKPALSRAAGAPLIGNNSVRLLKDAQQNYPVWLEAINRAKRHIHFESYIIYDDDVGQQFADALIARARE
jgi:cardiolipin synthase